MGAHFQMDAAQNAGVIKRILDDPTQLATAELDLLAATGVPALAVGDNRAMTAMQAIESTAFSIEATGSIPAFTGELAQYAGAFLSHTGQAASRAASLSEDRMVLRDEIRARRDSETGVNLDEELANMIIFQNAYTAAARMISAANEMFEVLLTIG